MADRRSKARKLQPSISAFFEHRGQKRKAGDDDGPNAIRIGEAGNSSSRPTSAATIPVAAGTSQRGRTFQRSRLEEFQWLKVKSDGDAIRNFSFSI